MADNTLVPYAHDNREIVLRRGSAVVVFDAQSRQLLVRDDSKNALELTECPYCHTPLRDNFNERDKEEHRNRFNDGPVDAESRSYVDPEYFGMLAQSQRASPAVSGVGTPTNASRRFFLPALRSGRSRDVSGNAPPSGAEFIASEPAPSSGQGISSSAFSPGYFKQFFREEHVLGRGGNGVVLLVEHMLDGVSLGHFACKRVPVGNDHAWLEKCLIEVKLLAQIPHKNLVKYHWVWVEEHQPSTFGPSVPCVWILQEYCSGGDLHMYVLGPRDDISTAKELKARHRRHSKSTMTPPEEPRRNSKLTLEEIFSFFRDITSGLHHLHSKGYIHRDLKPSNCLIQTDDGRTRVLISDFGEVQAAGTKRGNTGATGTISYCAPEVLRRDKTGNRFGDFTTKSDIFSLGMIVYFMCFGRLPYVNADDFDEEQEDLDLLRAEITAWPGFDDSTRVRSDLPERLYRFLKRLLSVDPNERPSTDEILVSIKAGAGLGEVASPGLTFDDGSARLTSISSPAGRSEKHSRHPSSFTSRPAFAPLGRSNTSERIRRSPSPVKASADDPSRHSSNSRPQSPEDASIVLRPRTFGTVSSRPQSPQQSPRLMLPPPPPRSAARTMHIARHPHTILIARGALFCVKILTLTVPCTPFAPRTWVLYPLLGLAVLDMLIPEFDIWRTVAFLGAHLLIVLTAKQHQGGLCEGLDTGGTWVAT